MSVELLSAAGFRRKLAGLVDPEKCLAMESQELVREQAVSFVAILPRLFSDDLDRKTLWERIGNGLVVAVAKCGKSLDEFVNHCLEYIKAEPGKVAACSELEEAITTMAAWPKTEQDHFLRHIETRHYIVLVKARSRWNQNKEKK